MTIYVNEVHSLINCRVSSLFIRIHFFFSIIHTENMYNGLRKTIQYIYIYSCKCFFDNHTRKISVLGYVAYHI